MLNVEGKHFSVFIFKNIYLKKINTAKNKCHLHSGGSVFNNTILKSYILHYVEYSLMNALRYELANYFGKIRPLIIYNS